MLRIIDITAPDINNGNGIRVSLWVAGCKYYCRNCQNQWTWKYEQGKEFQKEKQYIYEQLSQWLKRDYVDGLTLTGGDPFCQDNDSLCSLLEIINWVKENYPTKTIWAYSGAYVEDLRKRNNHIIDQILDIIDVIVDGPYEEEKRDIAHCPFRGSTNQRIIYLKNNEIIKR